jgi:hypothetical protein
MKLKVVALAIVSWSTAAALLTPPAAAQQPAPPSPSAPAETATVDVSRLPLDLHRVERQLRQNTEREAHEGLKLQYFVDVFGQAPKIQLFTPEEKNSLMGPAPWGAPTHKDMLEVMTPQEFRTPVMDFSGFMRWLQEKLAK